jgi:oligopeptide transport system ATP-binding protein
MPTTSLLCTREFNVRFSTPDGDVHAVRDIDLQLQRGEVMGVVGESGCGKTQLFLGLLGLIASNGTTTGSVNFDGHELTGLPEQALNKVRGNNISMVFQDPLSSLNPYLKIGVQLSEVLTTHGDVTGSEARVQSIDMLGRVGIPDAAECYYHYPHELSGGMRQRAMIAMAVLAQPSLLIADEATTALDVTVQAQIIDLLLDLNRSLGMAIALITHDLGIVAETCDRVAVMYAGRIVETGSIDDVFYDARHPYTQGLLKSIPRMDQDPNTDLPPISGQPPDLRSREQGCAFAPRCLHRFSRCIEERPNLRSIESERTVACHLSDQ